MKELDSIFAKYKGEKEELIPILQEVQEKLGYIPKEMMLKIAEFLKISQSSLYGVATFYTHFRFSKPPKKSIKVCLGTACHVKGGEKILDTFKSILNIPSNQNITEDNLYSVERVACVGCCALAPVVMVGKKMYAQVSPNITKEIILEE